MLSVKIKKITKTAQLPKYATTGSACFDLFADENIVIMPGETRAVSTGLAFEIPPGYQIKIYPRSGISLNTPLRLANSVAIIDSDYRGEVKVLLWNSESCDKESAHEPFMFAIDNKVYRDNINDFMNAYPYPTYIIKRGDRIAQAEIVPVLQASFEITDKLSETERGDSGFGSTGI